MKKIIFQVDSYNYNPIENVKDTIEIMRKYSVPSVKSYAKKIGADYRCLTFGDDELSFDYEPHGWGIVMKAKVSAWREMAQTDYDHFLFLDYDIFVTDIAPDIFEREDYKALGGFWGRRCSYGNQKRHKDKLYKYGIIINDFCNAGVTLCDRETAIKIGSHVPSNEILFKNSDYGNGIDYNSDEAFLGHVAEKENIRVREISAPWHTFWGAGTDTIYPQYFIHYQGNKGKRHLGEMMKEKASL